MGKRGPKPRPPAERFWEKIDKTESCWLWTGARKGRKGYEQGYGFFNAETNGAGNQRTVNAHRFAYELLVGPIPPGYQVDHLCENPPCVNPDHLQLVTDEEHKRRHRATHCSEGHVVVDFPSGRRRCRECHAARESARYHARNNA